MYMPAHISYKRKSHKNIKKGGDCGCNKSSPIFSVGTEHQLIKGGVALGALTNFDTNHIYSNPLNSYQNDPISPAAQTATRMDPNPSAPFNPFLSGGKKRRTKHNGKRTKHNRKSKKNISRRRRIRGGSDRSSDALLNGPILSTGTAIGAPIGANIILGHNIPILLPAQTNNAAPFI